MIKGRSLSGPQFGERIVASVVVTLFNLQSVIIQVNLKMFECQNIYRHGQPIRYLRDYLDTKCWTPSHYGWTLGWALPFLIVWVIVLPICAYFSLKWNKAKFNEQSMKAKMGFLYIGYKEECFWWELIHMFRKYCLIIVGIFGRFFVPFLQIYLYIYIIWFFYVMHHKREPYSPNSKLDVLERVAMICVGIVSFSGIYFDAPYTFQGLKTIIIIIAIIANWIFYCTWAYHYWLNYRRNNMERVRTDPKYRAEMENLVQNSPKMAVLYVDKEEMKKIRSSDMSAKGIASPKETQGFKFDDVNTPPGLASPKYDFEQHHDKFETSKQGGSIVYDFDKHKGDETNKNQPGSVQFDFDKQREKFETSKQNISGLNYDFDRHHDKFETSLKEGASPARDSHHLSKEIDVMDWNAQDTHKDDL